MIASRAGRHAPKSLKNLSRMRRAILESFSCAKTRLRVSRLAVHRPSAKESKREHGSEGKRWHMGSKRVADLFVDVLAEAGVQRIYGVSGDSLNGIMDSIRAKKQFQWIHVRHEEAAAFAAGAEVHLTGKLAVCAGSSGPGNLHLINGLYDCHRSRVPVLAIAAQIPSHEIGSGYFQETHPEHLFGQCSHYCELVSQPEQMPRVLE